jgi:hypothetical protein
VSQFHPDLEKELEDVILNVGVGDTKDEKLTASLDKVVFKWAAKHGIDTMVKK